jgi:hypothetical protein
LQIATAIEENHAHDILHRDLKPANMSNIVRSFGATRWASALLAGLIIGLAVPASAETIGISGGVLIVGTEAGDGNQVFAPTIVGNDLVFGNLNADIVTPGCTEAGSSISFPLADSHSEGPAMMC